MSTAGIKKDGWIDETETEREVGGSVLGERKKMNIYILFSFVGRC